MAEENGIQEATEPNGEDLAQRIEAVRPEAEAAAIGPLAKLQVGEAVTTAAIASRKGASKETVAAGVESTLGGK